MTTEMIIHLFVICSFIMEIPRDEPIPCGNIYNINSHMCEFSGGASPQKSSQGQISANLRARVVETIREQIEQTNEVRDASETIQSNLESIDEEWILS